MVSILAHISEIVLAFAACVGAVVALISWFYQRGGRERAFTEALDRNTTANNEVAVKLEDFRTVVLDMFHDFDKRLIRVEDRMANGPRS